MLKDTTRENRKQQVDEVHRDLLRNPKQGKTTGEQFSTIQQGIQGRQEYNTLSAQSVLAMPGSWCLSSQSYGAALSVTHSHYSLQLTVT